MQNQKTIKEKRRTIESIKKVTKAMEMISNIKLQRSMKPLAQSRTCLQEILRFACKIAGENPEGVFDGIGLLKKRHVVSTLFVAVASDKGLCGYFNNNILNKIVAAALEEVSSGKKVSFITVGKKARDFISKKGFEVRTDISASLPKEEIAAKIQSIIVGLFEKGSVDSVRVFYSRFTSVKRQDVSSAEVLPVSFDDLICHEPVKVHSDAPFTQSGYEYTIPDFIYIPDKEGLFKELLRYFIENKLLNILAESNSGEHASRMVAMQQATLSADDMIAALLLQYNKVRQEQITTEIIEVVSGVNALN
ncbi:MAG: ATP synthase F1 subunit gamma [Candidatus Saganbacteria bacterium]|nr:ATP synthase F1 subunit gamma [Candidatus Saganbacteria bacterium]